MNVIVIMLDSLRPDYLGCYGNSEVKSPAIDRIAEEGLLFRRAYAEFPITIPSRTAFLAGLYTHTNRPWSTLRPKEPLLAYALQHHSYQTAFIGDKAAVMPQACGFDQGMDEYIAFEYGKCASNPGPKEDEDAINISHAYFPETPDRDVNEAIYRRTLLSNRKALEKEGCTCPDLVTDTAMQWIEKNRKKPFFLWLDYFETHEPWDAPDEYTRLYGLDPEARFLPMPPERADLLTEGEMSNVLAHYKATVTQTDEQVARLDQRLEELGLKDDTLVVITSDHGEPFGEHGTIRKYGVPIYEELARIVLIMRKPGIVPAGKATDAMTVNVDLPSTVIDLLGVEPVYPGMGKFQGKSLLPVISGEADSIHPRIFVGAFQLHAGCLEWPWKFIDFRGEKENELYNLADDPGEKRNLATAKPTEATQLHRHVWEFNARWSNQVAWRDHPID